MIFYKNETDKKIFNFGKQVLEFTKLRDKKIPQAEMPTHYKPPEAKNVDEYFDMGSIEIKIDGEADPEMVMSEVKEIIEERKCRLQETNK